MKYKHMVGNRKIEDFDTKRRFICLKCQKVFYSPAKCARCDHKNGKE